MEFILVSWENMNLCYSVYALGFVRVKFQKQVAATEDQDFSRA